MNKKDIVEELGNHPYLEFSEHENLKAMVVCSESFGGEEEVFDFEELIFVVPTNWLEAYAKESLGVSDLDYWLQNEYTSDKSYKIYQAALTESKVVMINFN